MLDDVVDGAIETLRTIQQPTLAYFHFYPPHDPYCPTVDFFESFNDGWRPKFKPIHDLSEDKLTSRKLASEQQYYDEFIASWDYETGRLFDFLKQSGLTDKSYIFITADHGELFERGITGHFTKLIYDPLIHDPCPVDRFQPGTVGAAGCPLLYEQRGPRPNDRHSHGQSCSAVDGRTTTPCVGRYGR